ncbi:MAG: hypothetical protein Q9170_003433 [Blastenia crenularia]
MALVRAFRLGLLSHALRSLRYPTGRGLHEPTKIAINRSRFLALIRNLVHVIPFGFALFEIILNWNVYYVGTKPYGTAVYQIIAKAHEILIQASIGSIMFSAIRRELGHGLPFGFLFSGLQVTQVSYLWSMELWGALRAGTINPWRRITMFVLLAGCILLAATSGPASAVLLIPRQQLWPAGRTHLWINITEDQLWPPRIDGTSIPQACLKIGEEASNMCPASEWYAIRDWMSDLKNAVPPSVEDRVKSIMVPDGLFVHGQNSARNIQTGVVANELAQPRSATTVQAVVADALTQATAIWFESLGNVTADSGHGSPLSDQSSAAHTIRKNYTQPYAAAKCVFGEIGETNTLNRSVGFPIFTSVINQSNPDTYLTTYDSGMQIPFNDHPGISFSHLLGTPGNVQDYRLRWIELPGDVFNGSSIGAAILFPAPEPGYAQDLLLCNIAAAWGPSSLVVDDGAKGIGPVRSEFRYQSGIPTAPISQTMIPPAELYDPGFGNSLYLQGPQGSINISTTWAEYLNPTVGMLNTSLLSTLMDYTAIQGQEDNTAAHILSLLTANGLARKGWGSKLQGDIRTTANGGLDGNYWLSGKGDVFNVNPAESQNWVTLRMDSNLEGYAYNTLTTPPRVAIAILTLYCILALGHVIYSGITGMSSNAWDTIAEVVALAINSTPTAALRNTCAGISELHIFKLPVRVLVSKDVEGEGEHLELVFGQMDEEKITGRTIETNRTYGTLPRGVEEERKKDV